MKLSLSFEQFVALGLLVSNAALWLSIYDAWQRIG